MGITSLWPRMVSSRAIVRYYSANPKTIEGELPRVVTVVLLSCFDVERGVPDGKADTFQIRMTVFMRLTGIAQCQAQVPGQDHQVRRKNTGMFQAVMRRTVGRVEGRMKMPEHLLVVPDWWTDKLKALNVRLVDTEFC